MVRAMRSRGRPALLAMLSSLLWLGVVSAQPPGDDATSEETPVEEAPIEGPAFGVGGLGSLDPCDLVTPMPRDGLPGTPEELHALCEVENERWIDARTEAESILAAHPESYAARFVLAYTLHRGEANHPRARFEMRRALAEYVGRFGETPGPGAPWRWHSQMLQELVFIESDLEHYEEQLALIAQYNASYSPEMVAETAWPLMKLRRFDDARRAAELGRRAGGWQEEVALNALCAIEFEAGDETRSYAACRAALLLHGANPARQDAVDFTNYAEAARSVFRLDEAEENLLLATEASVSWYGNPYMELAELYTREGRFLEALEMLRQVHPYRRRRPPHVREADRTEARRALSAFYLAVGRSEELLAITYTARMNPDRRGHNSRDPMQDRALTALLDRAACRLHAAWRETDAVGAPLLDQLAIRAEALFHRAMAISAAREAARAIADDERLVGIFQIGRARSAVMPPWLAGELVQVLGGGVAGDAIRRAREEDPRAGSDAYYDAFEAEAALEAGDPARAYELARRAIAGLGPGEALLSARASAISAEAAMQDGFSARALEGYDEVFQVDPGLFVRMDLAVPVRVRSGGGPVADEVAEILAWSPRFSIDDIGLEIRVTSDGTRGEACLTSSTGAELGCTSLERSGEEDVSAFARRLAGEFQRAIFSPRISLSAVDASSLDGANTTMRGSDLDRLIEEDL
jgi:tetratricopeptide (TPR) repeat protein